MPITRSAGYELSALVDIEVADGVDPFYYVEIEDGQERRVWRMEGIYDALTTEKQLWDHLAYNALVNGVHDASRLDGWGDLERGQITMRVRDAVLEPSGSGAS